MVKVYGVEFGSETQDAGEPDIFDSSSAQTASEGLKVRITPNVVGEHKDLHRDSPVRHDNADRQNDYSVIALLPV